MKETRHRRARERSEQWEAFKSVKELLGDEISMPSNKQEAELLVPQWLAQASGSVEILNKTLNAKVFFKYYAFLITTLKQLAYCEKWISYNGELPSVKLMQMGNEKAEQMRLFILRFAHDTREKIQKASSEKAKRKKAEAFHDSLMQYRDRMDDENITLFMGEYESLKQMI